MRIVPLPPRDLKKKLWYTYDSTPILTVAADRQKELNRNICRAAVQGAYVRYNQEQADKTQAALDPADKA